MLSLRDGGNEAGRQNRFRIARCSEAAEWALLAHAPSQGRLDMILVQDRKLHPEFL